MMNILKCAFAATLLTSVAGTAEAAMSNNGQFSNGQFSNGQFQNGQFSNGQFQNGQFSNGAEAARGAGRSVVVHSITLSDGTVLTLE